MTQPRADSPTGHGKASAPVSLGALWFAILAAPLAWSTQELVSYGIASFLCRQKAESTGLIYAGNVSAAFMLVTLMTFAIAVAGGWVAVANWRKVRDVRRESNLSPREVHAERSRFMGRCGVICSVVFLGAFVFTTANLLIAPLCAR
jgi:hypothetical protein